MADVSEAERIGDLLGGAAFGGEQPLCFEDEQVVVIGVRIHTSGISEERNETRSAQADLVTQFTEAESALSLFVHVLGGSMHVEPRQLGAEVFAR